MQNVLLIILDGLGEGKPYPGNAVTLAHTPNLDKLRKENPWTLLKASGEAVGIPAGTQGGSEVGHFTLGSGRITFQSLDEINFSIEDGSFFAKPALMEACEQAKKGEKSALHLLGMISDQGVHSHLNHLFALLELAKQQEVPKIYIHAITDGRDVPEKSAIIFIRQIQKKIEELELEAVANIATIVGRYYAMDRDENWSRLQPAYDLYTLGKGVKESDPEKAVENAYARGIETDYYIDPIVLDPHGIVKDTDAVICWNYRSDRVREITWSFTGELDPKTGKPVGYKQEKVVRPFFVCLGPYSESAPVVFPTPIIKNNLGQVVAAHGLHQLRIAETQKYAHVTYFFNSQVEPPLRGEDRIIVESKKCHSYAETPEMSAHKITGALLPKLAEKRYALVVLNFANCDLVGHSGDLQAAIKAVETVDECLGRIVPEAHKNGYAMVITGDHGNVEYMIYEDTGEPCPSHTINPVPCIIVGGENGAKIKKSGELKDVAPTVLHLMGIEKPKEMTGESLL